MSARVIPVLDYSNETKNKIMEAAIRLFAEKGFAAVPMRDVAKEVGITIASIYYYYASKDALLDDIFLFFEKGYRHYFEWLSKMNETAETLEQVMDNMFNDEFTEMRNPIACLSMSLAIKEQHKKESARKCVFDLFYVYSIERLQADFDRLIEKGVIPFADTKTIALLFMSCVMVTNEIRIHEYMGTKPPLDCREIYANMRKHLTASLTQGTQQPIKQRGKGLKIFGRS